jgi:CheY-like chemotaxis protein
MPTDTIPIALLGFSDFERQAIRSYFERAAAANLGAQNGSATRYVAVLGLDDAQFVVADGDQPGTQALLEQLDRVADAVFVGALAPARAAAWLMRPLTPELVLRALDELRRVRSTPDSLPLPLGLPQAMPVQSDSGFAALPAGPGPRPGPAAHLAGRRLDDRRGLPSAASVGASQVQRAAVADRAAPVLPRADLSKRVLLVDDSKIALHFLRRLLLPYGLAPDMVRTASQALDAVASRAYSVVFLDVDLGEDGRHGGLRLCHQIRHQLRHPAGTAPTVVMVSAFHDPVDQVRGTLAGAEAYLGKPLDLRLLDQLLQRLGFVSTASAPRPTAPRWGRLPPGLRPG